MDRPLDEQFRRMQIVKRVLMGVGTVALLVAIFGIAPRWIRPSLSRNQIRTAVVDVGAIEATLSASGTVVPEFEQVLSSPLDARVIKILKKPGSILAKGEPILDLDVTESQLSLEKLNEQSSLKQNQQEQKRIQLENTLIDLRSKLRVKTIDLKSYEVQVEKQQRLRNEGLNSAEDLRLAQVNLDKARIELKQIEEQIRNAERSTQAELDGLKLEMGTLEKEKQQSMRQLDLATTKADRNGVLTWVVSEEGALVRKGDVLARIADLNSFRVDATLSDIHAARLTAGMLAKVKVGEDQYLNGTITNVLPTIKDGIVTAQIGLEDKSNKQLRSNLRVDVFVVTERKQKVMRVKRGPFANGEGPQDVFVARGGAAYRIRVRLGISNFDYYEVVSGLMPGDEVIISDMRDYGSAKEIRLN